MLLDACVGVAVIWEWHGEHEVANRWYNHQLNSRQELLVCRVSQMAILRLLTQRIAAGDNVLTQRGAWRAYDLFLRSPIVRFIEEPAGVEERFRLLSDREEVSPKRWTDDYLLAFAETMGMRLATLDRPLARRSSSVFLIS